MWGIQPLVVAKTDGNAKQQLLGSSMGTLVLATGALFIQAPHYTPTILIASFFSGVFCGIGQMNQFSSYEKVGVSFAQPILTAIQLIGTTLFGFLIFHEWTHAWQIILGTSALGCIIVGATFTSKKENPIKVSEKSKLSAAVTMLLSGGSLVLYVVITKFFGISGWDAILPQAVGIFVTALFLTRKDKAQQFTKATYLNILPGVIWSLGNLALLFSNQLVGVTTGFTFSQMGVVISTLGGLVLFKEKKTKKELKFIYLGVCLVVLGGVLIGVAKG